MACTSPRRMRMLARMNSDARPTEPPGYFELGYDYPMDEEDRHYMVEDGIDFEGVRSWALGEPFGVVLPDPITIPLVPVGGFLDAPPDMFDGYMCLMSARMVGVLRESGVDNLELFPAKLVDGEKERTFD